MDTDRIDLEDFDREECERTGQEPRYAGGWVDVKTKRPYAVARKIESESMRVIPKPGVDLENLSVDEVEIIPDLLGKGLAELGWHVVAWSLKDESGQPIPTGRAGILHEDFDDELGDWLTTRIDEIVAEGRRSKRGLAAAGGDA